MASGKNGAGQENQTSGRLASVGQYRGVHGNGGLRVGTHHARGAGGAVLRIFQVTGNVVVLELGRDEEHDKQTEHEPSPPPQSP